MPDHHPSGEAPATPADISRVEFRCAGCGSSLEFAPGTGSLKCGHCGAENLIPDKSAPIDEMDFDAFISNHYASEKKIEVVSVKCSSCGAAVTLQPNITADRCPYCGTDLVIKDGSTSLLLKPRALVPFAVDTGRARALFRTWLSSRWFAPSDLIKRAEEGRLDGVYIPYWTYDADTYTEYTGRKGTYYYVSETYTAMQNGRPVTRTQEVRHTQWTPASGSVSIKFDDILVPACTALPEKYIYALNPWNLKALVPFSEEYLSGFRAQSYETDLKQGLAAAKKLKEPEILSAVRNDIGGNEQEVLTTRSSYSNVTFKHILLPVWISSYRYGGKVYRFLINGQTGETQGERPYSALKIAFASIVVLICILIVFALLQK